MLTRKVTEVVTKVKEGLTGWVGTILGFANANKSPRKNPRCFYELEQHRKPLEEGF